MNHHDLQDIDAILTEIWDNDPQLMKFFQEAQEELEAATYRLCPWRNCEVAISSTTGKIISTIGPVGCGCDSMAPYWDGLPKPGFNIKARGKHGGRIARSRRRMKRYYVWRKEWE